MSQKSVKAFAQAILKRPGGLHILVNNAGLGYTKKSFTEDGVGMLTQVRRGWLKLPEGFPSYVMLHVILYMSAHLNQVLQHSVTMLIDHTAGQHAYLSKSGLLLLYR